MSVNKNTLEYVDSEIERLDTEVSEIFDYARSLRDIIKKLKKKKLKLEGREYYTYLVFVDKELKYIGKGKGDRWKHALSGASHVSNLNKDFFDGKDIEVRAWFDGVRCPVMEDMAIKDEADLIYTALSNGRDLYNKATSNGDEYRDCCFIHLSSYVGSTSGVEKLYTDPDWDWNI